MRRGRVVFGETTIKVIKEFRLLGGYDLKDFKEGGDALERTFLVISPKKEQVFDWLVCVSGIYLSHEGLGMFMHLVSGKHIN